ncbi:MAG: DUF1134 domain-containing protein [Sphingomonas fennica]
MAWGARAAAFGATAALVAAPVAAQVSTIDPNEAGRLAAQGRTVVPAEPQTAAPAETWETPSAAPAAPAPVPAPATAAPGPEQATYQDNDIFGAAEGVFGKGAEGLARMIEKIIGEHGRPNAYITGREAGGAFAVGIRYGSGTLYHKVEGERPVYWTGPSLGFDVGANGAKTFVLVYNLYDSQDLFHRFPAGEGNAYVIGGLTASYLRRGDVVLIPIRLGVGWRLGVNVGYMNFTEKARWLPF